jgi:hypothetical protein
VSTKVDIVMWAHRWHPIQQTCRESVDRLTGGDYRYHELIEPGTCHQNMNRAFRTGSARYVCLIDEDIEVLTRDWIWHLIEAMQEDDTIGAINCVEMKDLLERAHWLAAAGEQPLTRHSMEIPWIPAYVTLLDRERTPWYAVDEQIPGRKGMSDLDGSLLLRSRGFRCLRHLGVAVYHPHKGSEDERRAMATTTKAEELDCFPAQQEYMLHKWGKMFLNAVQAANGLVKHEPIYERPSWFCS